MQQTLHLLAQLSFAYLMRLPILPYRPYQRDRHQHQHQAERQGKHNGRRLHRLQTTGHQQHQSNARDQYTPNDLGTILRIHIAIGAHSRQNQGRRVTRSDEKHQNQNRCQNRSQPSQHKNHNKPCHQPVMYSEYYHNLPSNCHTYK